MTVRLSALRAGRALPQKYLLVLISVKSWVHPRTIELLEGLGKLRKFIHLIGSRTRDFLDCSIVPEPSLYYILCNEFVSYLMVSIVDILLKFATIEHFVWMCWTDHYLSTSYGFMFCCSFLDCSALVHGDFIALTELGGDGFVDFHDLLAV
jgi:hypothetical protein